MKTNSADSLTLNELISLAQSGNMEARAAAVEKLKDAEQTIALHSFRVIAGPDTINQMFRTITDGWAAVSRIEKIAKVGIAKAADTRELSALISSRT